ncbi:glucokinase [Thiobacter aerophilum]|uniref:Glucokinase n=1 Tax=Thiobacter aerophilum TaxID=3121275 RepID=A0ABV0EAW2_9BURK
MTPSDSLPCVLAADVGGSKTLLRLAALDDGRPARTLNEARFDSRAWPSLTAMIQHFLAGWPRPYAACLAVAAPVESRRLELTNLALTVDADEIETACGLPQVILINDFVAVGHGIEALKPSDLLTLQAGQEKPHAPRAVLGAGTGLGEAILVWAGDHYQVLPSEGGHVDFAPTDEEQIGLLRFLMARHGHVSYERILSGAGLVAVFEYLADRWPVSPGLRKAVAEAGAAAVSRAALDDGDAVANQALELFLRIYGAQAGNLALTAWAAGGVYLAGGIAPRLAQRFALSGFLAAFRAKGRYRDALARFPVHLVLRPDVGVMGALQVAARAVSRPSST